MKALKILWQFSRPHTIIGSLCSITALYILASNGENISGNITLYLLTLIAALSCNVFIVGINQIEDVEMDKINKPYLPLAAGLLSKKNAKLIVYINLLLCLLVSIAVSFFLFLLIVVILLIGVAYSLPPVKLKQHHLPAALAITIVRGLLVNIGMFLHFNYQLFRQHQIPGYIWCLTFFMMAFSIAIAWFKDLPDTEGDKKFRIKTLAVLYSKKNALWGGFVLVSLAYLYVIYWSLSSSLSNINFLLGSHILLLVFFFISFSSVKINNNHSIKNFYLRFWVFFFAEYIVFTSWVLL